MSDDNLKRHGPFQQLVGYKVVEDEQWGAIVIADIEEKHMNLNGVPHGGMVMTMLDAVGGRVVALHRDDIISAVTINLLVDFLNPCKAGRLIAVGNCDQAGKTVAYVSLKLYLDEIGGPLIAKASGTYRIFNKSLMAP